MQVRISQRRPFHHSASSKVAGYVCEWTKDVRSAHSATMLLGSTSHSLEDIGCAKAGFGRDIQLHELVPEAKY